MLKRKRGKKSAKRVARKKVAARKPARKKVTRKKAARRAAPRRPARKAPAPARSLALADRRGVITHTELASTDPMATRAWCEKVLGWKFGPPTPTPTGPYHMWRFSNDTGGGIRVNNPPEAPGTIPYCEVADIQAAYSLALSAGAIEMLAPQALPDGMGWIAIVAAPGGVAIGFWGAR